MFLYYVSERERERNFDGENFSSIENFHGTFTKWLSDLY